MANVIKEFFAGIIDMSHNCAYLIELGYRFGSAHIGPGPDYINIIDQEKYQKVFSLIL